MTQKFLWKNREEDLKKVIRYYDPNHRFEVMMYRTDLSVHTKRVPVLTKSLIPVAQECYSGFDPKLAELISIYHDDHELVGGDTSLQLKMQMTTEELSLNEQQELHHIDQICKHYPKKIQGYWYKELLLHALYKDCREAQLHSLADKYDGYNEAIHEVLAGNVVFIEPVLNYNAKTFYPRSEKFPMIKEIFSVENDSALLKFPVVDLMEFFANGKRTCRPHTAYTISLVTGIPAYEEWKRITLEAFPNGMELLTKQKEFH